MFFNENQAQYRDALIESIERFGEPQIKNDRGLLRAHTTRLGEVQTLFAVEHRLEAQRPIAVAVYTRTATDTMTLLQIAVHPDYAAKGPFATELVTMKLVQAIAKAASTIKGVRKVEMQYGTAENVTIAIVRRERTGRGSA